jgi:hypothetical protein
MYYTLLSFDQSKKFADSFHLTVLPEGSFLFLIQDPSLFLLPSLQLIAFS